MENDSCAFLPKACGEGIITREIDGELLIYDRTRDRAHCLNGSAAAVWKLCDGRSSVGDIAAQLSVTGADGSRQRTEESRQKAKSSEQIPVDEHVVWLALHLLHHSHLLEASKPELHQKSFWPPAIAGITNISRREAVRRIGLGAAIALPLVVSITVPTPAEAAVSCGATCHPCNSPIDCCGVCATSVPGCPGAGNKCT
jgi:hypothetical protein